MNRRFIDINKSRGELAVPSDQTQPPNPSESIDRRQLLGGLGGLTVGLLAGGTPGLARDTAAAAAGPEKSAPPVGARRAESSYRVRVDAADRERRLGIPEHRTNGDEERYPNAIGNFSKTLPHNEFGEVDPAAAKALRQALADADFKALDAVPKGGRVGYQDPIGGLCYSLYGPDAAAIAATAPPAIASREYATQLAELYWMALLRDVPFADYATHPLVRQACEDLSRRAGDPGPRDPGSGKVTPQTIFRAGYPGVAGGPAVSQLLLRTFRYDGIPVDPKLSTSPPGTDFLTHVPEWLQAQNGFPTALPAPDRRDPALRYLRSGRDLALLAGQDQIYSLFFRALLVLGTIPSLHPAAANPFLQCTRQVSFTTFGVANLAELLGGMQVTHNAFYLKWYVHRYLRPEEGAGLTHFRKTGRRDYPIHDDLLGSPLLDLVFEANRKLNRERLQVDEGSYLLPQANSFGCPTHPSFVSVHATLAGAAATLFKAWYDESLPFPDPVQPNADGTELVPYVPGKDGPPLTLGGEINKLCSNITFGRNFLGVHYRADSQEGNRVGEECMLRALAERKATLPIPFTSFTLTRFDGRTVSI